MELSPTDFKHHSILQLLAWIKIKDRIFMTENMSIPRPCKQILVIWGYYEQHYSKEWGKDCTHTPSYIPQGKKAFSAGQTLEINPGFIFLQKRKTGTEEANVYDYQWKYARIITKNHDKEPTLSPFLRKPMLGVSWGCDSVNSAYLANARSLLMFFAMQRERKWNKARDRHGKLWRKSSLCI